MLLQQLVESNLPVGLKHTNPHRMFTTLGSNNISATAQSAADLGLVEFQFVVGDPPGFLSLQLLRSLLLHVILLQSVWLDQLFKAQFTAVQHRVTLHSSAVTSQNHS